MAAERAFSTVCMLDVQRAVQLALKMAVGTVFEMVGVWDG